jgi:hypothetical protein
LNAIFHDQNLIRFLLILIGVLGIIFIFYTTRKRNKSASSTQIPEPSDSLNIENGEVENPAPLLEDPISVNESQAGQTPSFAILPKPSGIWMDIGRVLVILISLLVAAVCTMILLPQHTIDKISQQFQSRQVRAIPERIALLYLDDEMNDGQFRIRGVVRNITTIPIEQLDATVRFYAKDGAAVETVLVRLDKDLISPNEIARLDLVIPNYKMNFSGYSVEFKLREGLEISYKDMRSEYSPKELKKPALEINR